MTEKKYRVLVDDTVVAENMNLETALLLAKALFEKYYAEYLMVVSVTEMERAKAVNSYD